jgi:hypothetical protein
MDQQQNQTPVQNPVTTPIIPTEQIKPPHSHKILWILLSVFILLSVAGLFVFKNQIKEKSEVSLVQNIATTTDEFAGWKMFKSDSLGFSFMHPSEYGEFMIDDQADALFGYFVDKNKNYSPEQYFSISAVTKDYNSIYQYFLDIVDFKEKNENQFILQRNYNDDIEVASLKKYKLGDQQAIKVKNEDYDDEYNKNCQVDCRNVHGPNIIFIHLPMNAKYKVITFSDYDESKIDQILSTFKFLNTSTSTDTSTWKTYENKELGFSFKHPNEWEVNGGFQNIDKNYFYVGEISQRETNTWLKYNFNLISTSTSNIKLFVKNYYKDPADVISQKDIHDGILVEFAGNPGFNYFKIMRNNLVVKFEAGSGFFESEIFKLILSTFNFTN